MYNALWCLEVTFYNVYSVGDTTNTRLPFLDPSFDFRLKRQKFRGALHMLCLHDQFKP